MGINQVVNMMVTHKAFHTLIELSLIFISSIRSRSDMPSYKSTDHLQYGFPDTKPVTGRPQVLGKI